MPAKTLTAEEVRDRTQLSNLDAMLDEFDYTLEEAIEMQTNVMCSGDTPQAEPDPAGHAPAPTFRLLNLHCLICGALLDVKKVDGELCQQYELKDV